MKLRLVVSLAIIITAVPGRDAFVQTPTESAVKSVFLYNFTQFVDWPADSFDTADSPIVIGILGPDPFGKALEETIANEKVRGRSLEIHRYRSLQELENPQILFVSRKSEDLEESLQTLRGRPILTVSDAANFARKGGVVEFMTVDNHIRLRINLASANAARLAISSKLLRVAETIPTQP